MQEISLDKLSNASADPDKTTWEELLSLAITTSSLCSDPNELKLRLEKQMCNGVRWRETMDLMAKDSDLHFVEIGPSNVLSGLGKRYLNDVKISQVSSSDQISY